MQGLEVVLPDVVAAAQPTRRPITRARTEVDDRHATLRQRPRHVADDLLDEREQADVSFGHDVQAISGHGVGCYDVQAGTREEIAVRSGSTSTASADAPASRTWSAIHR